MIDYTLLLFLSLSTILYGLAEKWFKRNVDAVRSGLIRGLVIGVISVFLASIVVLTPINGHSMKDTPVGFAVLAFFEETSRFLTLVYLFHRSRHFGQLHIVGGAFGYSTGVLEFALSVINGSPGASLELFTALPTLTLLGIAMGASMNRFGVFGENQLSVARITVSGLIPSLAIHVGYNSFGYAVYTTVSSVGHFVGLNAAMILVCAFLALVQYRWWVRAINRSKSAGLDTP